MMKLIGSDLDETSFNKKHMIPDLSITTIEAARSTGITFMITTGREHGKLKIFMKGFFPFFVSMICYNGALYVDELGNPIFYNLYLLLK